MNSTLDISKWILKVIKSCETKTQLKGCEKLVNIFEKEYKDEELTFILKTECAIKWFNVKN